MKMTVVVSAAVCGAMLATNAGAETEVVDGVKWTYSMSAKGAVVGTGSWYVSAIDGSTRGMVIVPESLGGRPVVAVGCGAFYRCSELTAVTIPASVRSTCTSN